MDWISPPWRLPLGCQKRLFAFLTFSPLEKKQSPFLLDSKWEKRNPLCWKLSKKRNAQSLNAKLELTAPSCLATALTLADHRKVQKSIHYLSQIHISSLSACAVFKGLPKQRNWVFCNKVGRRSIVTAARAQQPTTNQSTELQIIWQGLYYILDILLQKLTFFISNTLLSEVENMASANPKSALNSILWPKIRFLSR